jgi:enamine deaminase RidA (YjgF/YER057c/UK114 family)
MLTVGVMLRHFIPAAIRKPFARYSHAVEIPAGARLLLISGQLGIGVDDAVPESAEAQADLCFRAITACLKEAGMAPGDVVRLNAYVTDRAHLPAYMAARDRFIADPPPASTLMIVSGFAREVFKVEVEALAAKQG